MMSSRRLNISALLVCSIVMVTAFQNCGNNMSFEATESGSEMTNGNPEDPGGGGGPLPPIDVCSGVSCTLDPLTGVPAVTTILLALGDAHNNQLVTNNASNQLIAESIVRYSSPATDPRILIVVDRKTEGEDPEDTEYIKTLLKRYNGVRFIVEPKNGLKSSDLVDVDLVWFNNPGHEMSSETSFKTLLNFSGAVVLQGDDMSRGDGFKMESLTGLKYIDNGTEVACGGKKYHHDNNGGRQFAVSLDSKLIPGLNNSTVSFKYGNDIDNTSVKSGVKIDIIATAIGGEASCTEKRPTIVRKSKPAPPKAKM